MTLDILTSLELTTEEYAGIVLSSKRAEEPVSNEFKPGEKVWFLHDIAGTCYNSKNFQCGTVISRNVLENFLEGSLCDRYQICPEDADLADEKRYWGIGGWEIFKTREQAVETLRWVQCKRKKTNYQRDATVLFRKKHGIPTHWTLSKDNMKELTRFRL